MARKFLTLTGNDGLMATGTLSDPEAGLSGPFASPTPSMLFHSSGALTVDSSALDSEGNQYRVLGWEQIGRSRIYRLAKEV